MKLGTKKFKIKMYFPVLAIIIICGSSAFTQDNRSKEVYDTPEQMQTRLLKYINEARAQRGKPALSDDKDLGIVATNHSSKMAFEKKLSHTFSNYDSLGERLCQAGIYFTKYGENVAYSETPVSTLIHNELMNSPEHRENILEKDFTHCAVRVVEIKGKYYVTQNFATLYTPMQPDAAETFFKKEIGKWLNTPIKHHPLWDEFARDCSRKKLQGISMNRLIRQAPNTWGKFYVHYLVTPDVEIIEQNMKKKLAAYSMVGLGTGVAFTRSHEFPGGAYAVTFLIFSNRFYTKSTEQMAEIVLDGLNKKRKGAGFPNFALGGKCRLALEYSKKAYRNSSFRPEPSANKTHQWVIFYQTDHLDQIPASVDDKLTIKSETAKKISIGVYCPLQDGNPGNYFLITLIVN